ncbi:unnamed protein product [Symbiodinium sp. CCMP2592]|nr:unnamed protein product [Symbiodinium sp. CCMP2592]
MPPPMTRHRRWVRQQLETWESWPDSVHLVFVRKLVEELSEQLDVAQDASSRRILSLHETQYAGCTTSPMLANCTGMLETVVVKDGEPAIDAPLFLPCGNTLGGDLRASDKTQRPACDMELLPEQCHLKVRRQRRSVPRLQWAPRTSQGRAEESFHRHEGCPVAASTPRAGTTETRPGRKSSGGDSEASTRLPDGNKSDSDIDEEWSGEEFAPHDLLMTNLLPFLSAAWLRSGQCRGVDNKTLQEVLSAALTAHVAEVGSMDRPEQIVAFVEQMDLVGSNPDTLFADVFQGRWWSTALASKRKPNFAESHAKRIVRKNLRSLLRHCRSSDVAVADAAMLLVMNHAVEALPFVQGPIAETMLGMTEELVESSISINKDKLLFCGTILGLVLRVLSKPQRQRWVSLLVLLDEDFPKQPVIWRLRLLRLADDDPLRTYAAVRQQPRLYAKSASKWDWEENDQSLKQLRTSLVRPSHGLAAEWLPMEPVGEVVTVDMVKAWRKLFSKNAITQAVLHCFRGGKGGAGRSATRLMVRFGAGHDDCTDKKTKAVRLHLLRELPDPEQPNIKACGSKCDKSTSTGPLACSFGVLFCGSSAMPDSGKVPDILAWRVTSAQTRSPEVLLRHVAELGRLDTPSDAVVAFSDGVDRILSDSEPFPDDVERKKRFDCQDWCVMLAKTNTTHFSEDYVRQTVGNNLTDLSTHCLDSDEGVRAAAHHIIQEHALGTLGFVKELIADTVLRQMTDILSTGRETQTTWRLMAPYMDHLEPLLRWLTKSQRQDWASLLVKFLHSLQSASASIRATCQKLAVGHLKLLCFADDDASRTYADERRQLLALSDSPDFEEVKNGMASLFRC